MPYAPREASHGRYGHRSVNPHVPAGLLPVQHPPHPLRQCVLRGWLLRTLACSLVQALARIVTTSPPVARTGRAQNAAHSTISRRRFSIMSPRW